tara:strand:+ start:111 stop:347 length:237 start_codon:yes stop_codon:yes gene_type:complete
MANVIISKPDVTTYWVSYGPKGAWYGWFLGKRGELKAWGEITPRQVMVSTWVEVDTYTDRDEWKAVLVGKGIDPDEDE